MGTRADFYIGRGETAEWLGSIAWDGYPEGLTSALRRAKTEGVFREHVNKLAVREDWTSPADGWPWPWDDSRTTDYAYAFDDAQVWASSFGGTWFKANRKRPASDDSVKDAVFPNMKDRQKVTLGPRSGVIVVSVR